MSKNSGIGSAQKVPLKYSYLLLVVFAGTLNNFVGESALVTASAFSLLEGVADVSTGTALLLATASHSTVAGNLLGLAALLAAARLVLESLFAIEFLLTGTENPVGSAVLR